MTTLAGLSPAGTLLVRAGEPKVLHVVLNDADGQPQSMEGRAFALVVRRSSRTEAILTIEAELAGDALYCTFVITAADATAIYEAGSSTALSYDLIERAGGGQRWTGRITVAAGAGIASDQTPAWVDLPVTAMMVATSALVISERGAKGLSASRQLCDAGMILEDSTEAMLALVQGNAAGIKLALQRQGQIGTVVAALPALSDDPDTHIQWLWGTSIQPGSPAWNFIADTLGYDRAGVEMKALAILGAQLQAGLVQTQPDTSLPVSIEQLRSVLRNSSQLQPLLDALPAETDPTWGAAVTQWVKGVTVRSGDPLANFVKDTLALSEPQLQAMIARAAELDAASDRPAVVDISQPEDLAAAIAGGWTVPTYTGIVASDIAIPDSRNSAVTQFNSRSAHIMRGTPPYFQIAFANSYASEVAPGGVLTVVDAFLEYPVGTFTRITWSGGNSTTAPDREDTPLSDRITPVPPPGAQFFIRSYITAPAGVPFRATQNAVMLANGGGSEYGSSLTSKAGGGNIPVSNVWVSPVLIVGPTNQPSINIFGDSISVGVGESVLDLSNDVGISARSIGPHFGYLRQGVAGESLSTLMDTSGTRRRARALYCSHIFCEYGRNDLSYGAVASSLTMLLGQLIALYPKKPVFQSTITPLTTSTDNWATVGNQTIAASETQRLAYNAILRARAVPGLADVFDVAPLLESALDSGKWIPGTVFLGDNAGVHPSTAGYLAVRQSGVIDPMRLRFRP